MTVLETTGPDQSEVREPIKFPGARKERREERLRRKNERVGSVRQGPNGELEFLDRIEPEFTPDQTDNPIPNDEIYERQPQAKMKHSRWRLSWTALSFILMVAIPGAITSFYYLVWASPQYQVETQFSVRGSNSASIGSLGLSGLFGTTSQSGDSYIVSSYVESIQLIRDVKDQLGIDLRQYYTHNDIDWLYRIKPTMPLEKFTDYWRDMVEVSYNSTTGNTTLYIYAFSADDSKAIADAVLKVSENLVNNLSEASRQQMTSMASKQVLRAEQKLQKIREDIRQLRAQQKTIDPSMLAKMEGGLQNQLQGQLSSLQTRYNALLQSVDKSSPSARTIQKQIKALEQQLVMQKDKIGDPNSKTDRLHPGDDDTNIAAVLNKFEELTVQQGFATQAYTTSLAAFETALAEAQKQERYFATFVSPVRPEIALYPLRLMDSLIAILVLIAVWMISQFLYRSFRDHAI